MKNADELLTSTGETLEYARQYAQQQADYLRLEIAERISKVFSSFATVLAISFFAMMVVVLLAMTAGLALGKAWGSYTLAFSFVSGIYLLATVLLIVFRRRLITNPMLSLIIKSFFD